MDLPATPPDGDADLRKALAQALRKQFFAANPQVPGANGSLVSFPARHPGAGNLLIWAEPDEAIVEIEGFTHGHFACYDESLTEAEARDVVICAVIEFVKDLFADRVLLWQSGRGMGGWRRLPNGDPEDPAAWMPLPDGAEACVWSGSAAPDVTRRCG